MNGKARHLTKLYNYPVKYLMANFISNYDHLHIQFHEQSIFMKYIYNASRHTVILSGKNKEIQKLIINEWLIAWSLIIDFIHLTGQMLNKVDDGRNNRRERSLLQLHDEEDLLISHDV